MGYAPISRVLTPPSPADSGTTLTVTEDAGISFPDPPFVALVWVESEIPQVGVNAEYLSVSTRDGDDFTFARSAQPLAIEAGYMFAAVEPIPVYQFGETIMLSHDFGSDDQPYALSLRAPTGEIGAYGSATGVTHDSNGVAFFSFDADRAGMWFFRWESAGALGPDLPFFVSYSDTLS